MYHSKICLKRSSTYLKSMQRSLMSILSHNLFKTFWRLCWRLFHWMAILNMASQRLRFAANMHTLSSFGSAFMKRGLNMYKSGFDSIAASMSLHLNV